ncbi:hypothetical protein B0H14DRAFT_2577117 [Mycena olivaceomarginata]|nr:hypothetical protein B0H14DRAFT_2577117 [Mycena olivaceomarginata]
MQDRLIIRKYGIWPSPVGPEVISDQVVAYEALAVDPSDGIVYYVERRLTEGRSVLVDSAQKKDVLHTEYNFHGYGGAPVTIRNGVAFFTNVPDFRIYKVEGGDVAAITPDAAQFRFGNLTLHPSYPNLMIAVREDHSNSEPANVIDTVVSLNMKTGVSTVVSEGWDFYANPVFNPSGTKLAWLRWNHPDMPFRSTQLVVGDVHISEDGHMLISNENIVAGEPHYVAQQALWLDDNRILFVHDASGWIQPWIHFLLDGETRSILKQPILAEFAEAMWGLGMSSKGFASLIVVRISSGTFEELPSPFVDIKYVNFCGSVFSTHPVDGHGQSSGQSLDVMYSGSTGYGRRYMADADPRERLDGKAAQLDVQECVEATRQTADKGLIDLDRVVITGAGGPSVLMSLINFPDFYAAGCSQSSVCDVAELYYKSPKLQLFYPALLLGGSPEEVPEVYRARSPLFHAEKIKTPVLVKYFLSLRTDPKTSSYRSRKPTPSWPRSRNTAVQVEYLRFENEGHGFRRAASYTSGPGAPTRIL